MARKKKIDIENQAAATNADQPATSSSAPKTAPEIPNEPRPDDSETIVVRRETKPEQEPTAAPEITEPVEIGSQPEETPAEGAPTKTELSPGDQTADIEDPANG